ncbi:MAG: lipase family protein [Candidatus Saccharibacteria bacterium]
MTEVIHKKRHQKVHRFFTYLLIFVVSLVSLGVLVLSIHSLTVNAHQNRIKSFYKTDGLPKKGRLGEIIRSEPLGIKIPNGYGLRILYRTQSGSGDYTFSSGMVFIPDNTASATPRPIVAWAHGTLGLGDACTPSRLNNPVKNISWISQMLSRGWVVTATDYAGFGTPGNSGYLLGKDEAYDVLNSVRAARTVGEAHTSNNYAVWGHSQGGNSALFSSSLAKTYAPDLRLISTVASAPAAELVPLFNEQYGTVGDWVIGPLLGTSWPASNKNLNNSEVMTKTGLNNFQRIANQCILQSSLVGLIRNLFGMKFYSQNPVTISSWKEMAKKQSAPVLKSNMPLLVVESKADKVVLPNTTALYIQSACKAGSNLDSLWVNNVAHQAIPKQTANQVIAWIGDRFNNIPNQSTCSQQLPVVPASDL